MWPTMSVKSKKKSIKRYKKVFKALGRIYIVHHLIALSDHTYSQDIPYRDGWGSMGIFKFC